MNQLQNIGEDFVGNENDILTNSEYSQNSLCGDEYNENEIN